MTESNIFFKTNTYKYGKEYSGNPKNGFNDSVGDATFFRQVMDYDALKKFKSHPKMYGGLNSRYYVAHIDQIHVLDPEFSVVINSRKRDPEIEEENRLYDEEYGYPEKNNYYPLIEEIVLDNREFTYADDILGKWLQSDLEKDEEPDNRIKLFIKQAIERDLSDSTISPEEAGFEDVDDINPYYYLYEETARRSKETLGDIDKAKLYEEKYGSIFRAFADVTQDEIIHAPVEQNTFVNAGPGTGKTYTLISKIAYMVRELQVDPEGIWVLCFTNAAVNEIKERIRKQLEDLGDYSFLNIDVRTFDSFGTRLISLFNEEAQNRSDYSYIDLSKMDYNPRIRCATGLVRKFGEEVFGYCDHLIIDEIQDLTNERASLVISMVRECLKNGVGITLLGDSCQAIYDYSDDGVSFVLKSDRFYKYVFSEFYEKGCFYKLDKNIRQNEWLINNTAYLRSAILEGKKDSIRNAIQRIRSVIPEINSSLLSVVITEQRLNMMTEKGTVCLMCRSNAQVLATSTNLRKRGIEHIVNAYNEFEYLADWIGKIFGFFSKEMITIEEFEKRFKKVCKKADPIMVWKRLQDVIGSENNVLKVSDILEVISKSKLDDPLFRNVPHGNLIVSNIHKSKGREYNTVVLDKRFVNWLINDSRSIKSIPQYIEEAKTLYVAVTRPRNELFFNNLANSNVSLKKIRTGRKRWVRGDGHKLVRIETRAVSDVDVLSYKNPKIQKYIVKHVSEGDEINLVMDNESMSINYLVVHSSADEEHIIGKMNEDFIDDIDAIISPYHSPWPQKITDLYVSGIRTEISPDYKSVWCWVDFCGLGNASVNVY